MLSHGECCFDCAAASATKCDATQLIDLNTFTADELQQAMQAGLRYDGVWMVPENTPDVRSKCHAASCGFL